MLLSWTSVSGCCGMGLNGTKSGAGSVTVGKHPML